MAVTPVPAGTNTTSPDPLSARRERMLPVVLLTAGLLASFVGSLGTPLIPSVAHLMGVSLTSAQWILTVTLLVGSVTSPLLGRLGDGHRQRAVLLTAVGGVAVGGTLAALAPNFAVLVAGRALQGLGMSAVPLTIAIARRNIAGDRMGVTVRRLSISAVVGAGLGFPVTGVVSDHLGVRWAFAVVVALAIVVFLGVLFVVPARTGSPLPGLDLVGAAVLAAALVLVLLGITQAAGAGWLSAHVLGMVLGGLGVLALWVLWELRQAHPLIDVRLLRHRAIRASHGSALLMGFCLFFGMSVVNRLAQAPSDAGGFGASVTATGLLLLPLSIASGLASGVAARVERRWGVPLVLPFGATLCAVGYLVVTFFHGFLWFIALPFIVVGLGIGIAYAAMPLLILSNVPPTETGSASSMNMVLRWVGGALASAISISLLGQFVPDGATYPDMIGYTVCFGVTVAAAAGAAVLSLVLLRPRPERDADPVSR